MLKPNLICLPVLLIGFIFFSSCNQDASPASPEPAVSETDTDLLPVNEAVRQFFFAWMADVANDRSIELATKDGAESKLEKLAADNIKNALLDSVISKAVGDYSIAWGPEIVVSEQDGNLTHPYTVENMMYCTFNENTNEYAVGIAGTNMVSPYDWLTEDFNPVWVDEPITGGKIAQGTNTGLEVLKKLEGKDFFGQTMTLVKFLQTQLQGKKGKVTVAGHSLGGALTQVYANYLRDQLDTSITVQAWPFAGPTAGNQTFAKALVEKLGKENYHAFNNRLDVVPHAWEPDSLQKVCNIYQGMEVCKYEIGKNPLVSMINEYLFDISTTSSTDTFTIPGSPSTFESNLSNSFTDCVLLFTGIGDGWNTPEKVAPNLYESTKPFIGKCKLTDSNLQENTFKMMLFLAELGEQHTSAYTEYFFQDTTLRKSVIKYASPEKSDEQELSNADEGLFIVNQFLERISTYFSNGKNPSCTCK